MVDGKKDVLTIGLIIEPPALVSTTPVPPKKSTGRSAKAGKKFKAAAEQAVELEILIGQDMQRLRAPGGDTGSVVWRSRSAARPLPSRRVRSWTATHCLGLL